MFSHNRIPIVELIGIFFLVSSPSPGNLSASSTVDVYNFTAIVVTVITKIPVMTIATMAPIFPGDNFFLHFSFFEGFSLLDGLSVKIIIWSH